MLKCAMDSHRVHEKTIPEYFLVHPFFITKEVNMHDDDGSDVVLLVF